MKLEIIIFVTIKFDRKREIELSGREYLEEGDLSFNFTTLSKQMDSSCTNSDVMI